MFNPARRSMMLAALLVLLVFRVGISATAQDAVAWELLTRVNAARAAAGTGALTLDARLLAVAQRHSDDMAQGDFLGHQGSDGTWPADRVTAAGYVWNRVGENALFRWDLNAEAAFDQWWESAGHRDNMLNPAYMDVGIAWAQAASGKYYYTVVLASRPAGQPAVPVLRETATPTSTLTLTTAPVPTTNLPPTAPALQSSSTSAASSIATAPQQVIVANSPTPFVIIVTSAPTTPTSTPRLAPTIPYETLAPPTSTPPPPADLRLVFDDLSFTLINVGAVRLDLTELTFVSEGGALSVARWDTQFLTAPLSSFPTGGCLQAWDINTTELPAPDACDVRHAWIAVNSAGTFWRGVNQFYVTLGGAGVATCETWRGVCDVNLSQRVVLPTERPILATATAPESSDNGGAAGGAESGTGSASSSGADLRLIYDAVSFALVNISGGALNLSGLGFSGPAGTLNISAWDNGFLSAPLSAFPATDCLQVWDVNTELQPAPAVCDTRHAWIAVNDSGDFWRDTFSVSQNGTVLSTCSSGAEDCEIWLP